MTNQRRQELYDQAHCVLLPYTSISAQSGVLYDAYSQRLPVIASKVGPIGETVREHRSGWWSNQTTGGRWSIPSSSQAGAPWKCLTQPIEALP